MKYHKCLMVRCQCQSLFHWVKMQMIEIWSNGTWNAVMERIIIWNGHTTNNMGTKRVDASVEEMIISANLIYKKRLVYLPSTGNKVEVWEYQKSSNSPSDSSESSSDSLWSSSYFRLHIEVDCRATLWLKSSIGNKSWAVRKITRLSDVSLRLVVIRTAYVPRSVRLERSITSNQAATCICVEERFSKKGSSSLEHFMIRTTCALWIDDYSIF